MAIERPRALVTGASSGIGRVYAEHLARTGHDLILVARRADRLQALADALAQEHRIEIEVLPADLGESDGVETVARRIEAGARIDMLINNAGYAARARVAELDFAALEAMLRVNILALARLSQAALKRMIEVGRGTIINIASGTVFMQMPGNAGYGASKNFVTAFTRHMQVEAAGTGVRVQLLVPGVIATDFHEVAGNDLANFPPERVMSAEDLVVASLRALELGEEVCIPSLPDMAAWDAYADAEAGVAANVSRDRIAPRYHAG
ncbi:SDR family oxidoreductase [Sphingomonas parva]|uniref:NADP-dependent 3-hydroxy acid dehydrogenase YdfG n=1 Tax=Sphingomonas parva TaxID=2555898 RepID=A0A4Y8ZVP8_9SPHN|nr:SDR family oxidoreductase [Sphingomonas parva]TFI58506.1 SDR family oxidoreductase [Sphingomonas parva]